MTEPLLRLEGLSKAFGALKASDGIDLTVMPGEIHALIGPNGAGKSTLIAQIAGGLKPDAGRVQLLGAEVTGWPGAGRAATGSRCAVTMRCARKRSACSTGSA